MVNGWEGWKGWDRKGEDREERRSVTLQVPRPRSLSWATSIDNLLSLSLSLLPFLVGIIGIPRGGANIALPERVLQVESSATTQATMTPSNVSCKSHRRDPFSASPFNLHSPKLMSSPHRSVIETAEFFLFQSFVPLFRKASFKKGRNEERKRKFLSRSCR